MLQVQDGLQLQETYHDRYHDQYHDKYKHTNVSKDNTNHVP